MLTAFAGSSPPFSQHVHRYIQNFGVTIPGQKTRFTTQLYWNEVAQNK